MASFTTRRDKSTWLWTLMIMVGDHVTPVLFDRAVETVAAKSAKKGRSSRRWPRSGRRC